ncbi:COG4223 family protein [Rhizobium sp. CFBP 8762]|uniref:COG4223 family protein n=1 Tax=Rhizobium sp. CFBP 8762 TaxID=2775279 RepID=UPI0017875CBE|nr:COG4223 family protein [Rhizobium sp. CFBP 8762]MBD8555479.1 COG4223 family protein [Rhizobium sp. CFBP 8762]
MVSGTPPRDTADDREPTTIELSANQAALDDATTPHDTDVDLPPAQTPVADDQADASGERIDREEADYNAATDSTASAFAEEPAHTAPVAEPVHTTRSDTGPSRSGSLAAGIVGGLVALLAAGGLQYAGVLPAVSPDRGTTTSATDPAIAQEIEAIKAQLAAPGAQAQPVDLSPVETRLSELEAKLANAAPAGEATPSPEIPALQSSVEKLMGDIDSVRTELRQSIDTQNTSNTDFANRLYAAEEKLKETASPAQVERVAAATALKAAVEHGGSFLTELDGLAKAAPDDEAISALRSDAASGLASRAELARDFPKAADAMLLAINQPGPDQGVMARLWYSAASTVRVRPVGNVEGTEPEAVIARIEDKLNNGDVKGAALEWDALPPAAQTAGAPFKTRLDQRLRVEELVSTSVSRALSGTGSRS